MHGYPLLNDFIVEGFHVYAKQLIFVLTDLDRLRRLKLMTEVTKT